MAEAVAESSVTMDASMEPLGNRNIMIVGSNHKAAMEQYYMKYLKEFKIPHSLFPAQGIFYEYYEASLIHKIIFKAGIASIYNRINEEFISQA